MSSEDRYRNQNKIKTVWHAAVWWDFVPDAALAARVQIMDDKLTGSNAEEFATRLLAQNVAADLGKYLGLIENMNPDVGSERAFNPVVALRT